MKKIKGKSTRPEARDWWRKNRLSCLILAAAVVLFFAVRAAAVSREPSQSRGEDYAEYERGVITDVLADNTETDEVPTGDTGASSCCWPRCAQGNTRVRPCRCPTLWGRCTASRCRWDSRRCC